MSAQMTGPPPCQEPGCDEAATPPDYDRCDDHTR